MHRRLAVFIREEIEPILKDWEEFAETILSADHLGKTGLRDHAKDMLLEIADDLESSQSESEQTAKAKGHGKEDGEESSAKEHGGERLSTGFSVVDTVSEFRALRASVVSHWTKAHPKTSGKQLKDLTRFHEAIDQAVAESLKQYSNLKEMETRLFGAVLLASPDPIYVLSPDGKFIYANKATTELFALETKEIVGQSLFDLELSFAAIFQHSLEKVVADQTTFRGKFVHTFDSGAGDRFEYLLAPVLDDKEQIEAIVCITRDVTEQEIAAETIWHNAHHDLLTGLPNRRLFLDRLEQEIKHAKRANSAFSVLFLDLDGFKQVNDSFGHEAGDLLLSAVAERLTDCVREEDTVARMGGDEFTLIITGVRHDKDAERVARNIREALSMPFEVAKRSVQIFVSIGISFYPDDAATPDLLLEAADQAMYKAKKAGTGQIYT